MFTQHMIRSSDGVGFTVPSQTGDHLEARSLAIKTFFLSAAIIGINLLINLTSPVTAFPHDDFILIDGIWRIVQGQHAGIDYYDPVGFGLTHIGAAWWRVIGPDRSVLVLFKLHPLPNGQARQIEGNKLQVALPDDKVDIPIE